MGGKFIIAIDGPAAAGKSTIAKLLAEKRGYLYIDTGAMYRALTWKALEERVNLEDEGALVELARKTRIYFRQENKEQRINVDERDVTLEIRKPEVTGKVSYIAKAPLVRKYMVALQRQLSDGKIVMEGRDIGTVVFPDADWKFYLEASLDERTTRRYKELREKGYEASWEKVREEIKIRDEKDEEREVGPLRKASDAILIDTTNLTIEEVLKRILWELDGDRPTSFREKLRYWFYEFLHYIAWPLSRLLFRFKVVGVENVPKKGPVILAANHLSLLDPIVVGNAIWRHVNFMAKEELFKNPFLRWLIITLNAFPVKRGAGDRKALKKALEILAQGRMMLIFVEGTRSRDGKLQRGKPGVGFLALRSKATVVPTLLIGTNKLLFRGRFFPKLGRVEVRFGKPLSLEKYYRVKESKDIYQTISDEIMGHLRELQQRKS